MLQIRRILQLKKQGKSNRKIALELQLSRLTVNGYVKRLQDIGQEIDRLPKMEYWAGKLKTAFFRRFA